MPMRDYEDLKNLKIPAEQERIMDIICDAWEECRETDCQSECKDNQVLPCERTLFACTALKYSRKIHEAGYTPSKWIDVNDRLPETADDVLVALSYTYGGTFCDYSTARYIDFDDGAHWYESKHGYLEWNRYSDGHGGSSSYKVIAWMPIPTYKEKIMSEWISVNDRLPEKLEPVNIVWKNMDPAPYYADIKNKPFVGTAYYFNGKWWWFSPVCEDYLAEYGRSDADEVGEGIVITHWMPIPYLPEMEK